jgi:membrane fusion protein (multidrug efflux system)
MAHPLLPACFLLALCFFSCERKPTEAQQPYAASVTAYAVTAQTIPAIFSYIGFAESSHPVEIRGRVEGYLDRIAYKEGGLVYEGDLLFQLDPSQFQAAVAQARGEVARQKAILENAKLTVNRLQPLYEQKAASKKDLDNAISNKLAAEASLLSAEAQLLNAEINLGYTTIRSPITGLSDKSRFREGTLITPGPNNLMTTISVVDPIWVYFTVSESDILQAQKSRNKTLTIPQDDTLWDVQMILTDDSIFPYTGKVDFSAPTYDQSTGTLLVRAVFPNPKSEDIASYVYPGQFVRVKVFGATRPNALLVPRKALIQKNTGFFVYLIDKENRVVAQDVSVGEWYGDDQIVTNGLKDGDLIVLDGTNKVRPGTPVHVESVAANAK